MNFKRLVAVLLAACMLLAVGCSEEIKNNENYNKPNPEDYAEVDGYYTKVANRIEYADGRIAAYNYYVCRDEACTQMVGSKRVSFDDDGNLSSYEIVIGVLLIEKQITFTKDSNGSTYNEIVFNSNGSGLESGKFDDIHTNSTTGVTERHKGYQYYYDNGIMKNYHEEHYEVLDDGTEKLVATIDRTFNKDGTVATENIVNH